MYEYECRKCGHAYYTAVDYNTSYQTIKNKDELDLLDLFFTCSCGGLVYYSEPEQIRKYGVIITSNQHDNNVPESALEKRVETDTKQLNQK